MDVTLQTYKINNTRTHDVVNATTHTHTGIPNHNKNKGIQTQPTFVPVQWQTIP